MVTSDDGGMATSDDGGMATSDDGGMATSDDAAMATSDSAVVRTSDGAALAPAREGHIHHLHEGCRPRAAGLPVTRLHHGRAYAAVVPGGAHMAERGRRRIQGRTAR